jgi:quinol monooxygenase YgiN
MPVWEIAEFAIEPGKEERFEKTVLEFASVFEGFEGCTALQLQKSVDVDSRFLLLIEWESVEHHTEKAPTTDGFKAFVAAVEPLYAEAPRVYHTQVVEGGF